METTTIFSINNNTDANCSLAEHSARCPEDNNSFNTHHNNTENASQTSVIDIATNLIARPTPPLISDELTYILEIAIVVFGLYVTSLFGVCANVINTVVYVKQGLTDSITLGLFALSISDLLLVIMPLVTASCHAADYLLPNSPIDFPSIHYASSGWMRNMMYSMSCIITAVLSLERCCCIILPFQVKTIFTRGKTAFIIGTAFLFHFACILILPMAYELTWWPGYNYSISNNMTRIFRVVFFEEGEAIEVFNTTVMSLIVPSATQAIVTVCVVVMIHGLRASAEFRNKTAARAQASGKVYTVENKSSPSADVDATQSSDLATSNISEKQIKDDTLREKSKIRNRVSGRDARLIKTMIFLVTIQSACNIPFLAATFAWRSIPEMNIGMPYENTLRVVFSLVYLLGNLNASCNVFVYYHTSSTFRFVLGSMCCRQKKKQKEVMVT